jgi:hypothetical protein
MIEVAFNMAFQTQLLPLEYMRTNHWMSLIASSRDKTVISSEENPAKTRATSFRGQRTNKFNAFSRYELPSVSPFSLQQL